MVVEPLLRRTELMSTTHGDVLTWGPMHASLMQQLERDYRLHKRWEISDLCAWATTHGAAVRAIVTSGVYGADNALLERLPNLEVITSFGVGYDAVDTAYLARRGIKLSNTPDALNNSVAETAMALMLSLTRRISEAERFVRAGKWLNAKFPLGNDLVGKTCGIVGLGKIGKTIAKRAAALEIVAADRKLTQHSALSQPLDVPKTGPACATHSGNPKSPPDPPPRKSRSSCGPMGT